MDLSGSGVRDILDHVGDRNTWVCSSHSLHNFKNHGDLCDLPISDLTWPRFGSLVSLKSKFRQSQANVNESGKSRKSRKHLDINEWLKILDLEQYRDTFLNYHGVEELLEHTEADVKDLGIRIASHRARIMSSLTALRTKYYNNNGTLGRDTTTRHSVAADNRIKIQAVDTISDLKVVSDAIQSKSLNNLIMEPCMDPAMDAVALKKALEWELSLDARDLRSHAWYHGAIPRARAEDIVRDDGCFLIRDCTSQPGNYVLTCRTKQQALHFVINKIILQPDTVYERVQYQFEDDAFDTVPDLITYYVGSGKPITIASAARIQFPKNRLYPLSFYASKYPTPLCPSRMVSPATTPIVNMQMRCSPINPGLYKASPSPTRLSRETPPRLPSKKQRSHSLTPSEVNRVAQEKCNSADGVIQSPLMTRSVGSDVIISDSKFSTHSLPRNPCTRLSLSPSTIVLGRNSKNITRVTSDPSLSPCAERRLIANEDETNLPDSPPPKPSRIPSILRTESKESDYADTKHSLDTGFLQHGTLQRVTSYHASGSDSGNGSGDSALSSAAGDPIECNHRNSGVVIKNPRYNMTSSESTTTLKNYDFDYKEVEEKLLELPQPELNLISKFDLENFQTILLPASENKPLDSQALKGIKLILKESGSRILANHLTKTDLEVVFGSKLENSHKKFGNGIELCLLPHGHQLRLDLIERTECLKLMVAITILTSPDEAERTETLNKWIEVAIDTKTALGNLFGFCGIMLGLCLPQVQRLDTTWHMLRQKYTDSAFNFEAKLRPTLKNMNNCSNPQAPNTTIPHLLPFVLLMERNLDDFLMPNDHQTFSCLNIWEINTQDFGLGTLLAHLESARKFLDSISIFQRNAEIVLGEARMEDLTLDMFKTEFQIKFLWGSRGAFATPVDRYNKFEQLLDVVADKYCNSISEQTEF